MNIIQVKVDSLTKSGLTVDFNTILCKDFFVLVLVFYLATLLIKDMFLR